MKKLTLLMALLFAIGMVLHSQEVQVKGKVTSSEDGSALPGASVIVKGTQVGTVTDGEGNFVIKVPSGATTLVVSFVGMKTQEVDIAGRQVVDVVLQPEVIGMEEVVVTALGIKRSEKALGYSAVTIGGEDIAQTRTNSLMNSLQGKIAGVTITSNSGAPGASTKVIIRGFSSITGNNEPLYVIDGVPVNNTRNTLYADDNDVSRTQDFGNRANDINPDDIESVTILKGAAAALYGSRAANGVIMITTKQGKKGDKFKVEYNGSATFSEPLRLPQLQNWFGQGWNGSFKYEENGSWGPKFDGKLRLWGNVVDNSQQLKPYVAQKNNLRDFFDIGKGYNNSIAISGGKDNATFYLSYGNVRDDGIVPTDADSYNRNSLMLKGSYSDNRLTANAALNYINKKQKFVTQGQGSGDGGATLYQDLMQIPRDFSIVDLKDYKNKFNNLDNYFTPYADNPYFIINENGNKWNEDRILPSITLDYKLFDWISAIYRVGADISNAQLQDWGAIAKTTPGSINNTRGRNDIVGRVNERTIYDNQINHDIILNSNFVIKDFKLNAIVGYNINERFYRELYSYVSNLNVDGFYNLSNSSENPHSTTYERKRRLYGLYTQEELSYKDYVYLTLSARNDWSSTLPKNNNSFFYPGVSVSVILSEIFSSIKPIVPFAKIRYSHTLTGNDPAPYSIYSVFSPASIYASFGNINFPIAGINAFEIDNVIGNSKLKPEISIEDEAGLEMYLFDNRVKIDFSVYKRKTDNQIMRVPLARSSGFATQVMNIGAIENKGTELLLSVYPIKTQNFEWLVGINHSINRSKVLELNEQLEEGGVLLNNAYDIDFLAKVGKPLGVIEGPDFKRDPQGRIIVNDQGIPVAAEKKTEYGTTEAKYRMGIKNEFTFKGLTLGGNVEIRQGGLMYTYTADINYFVGNATQTTFNDRQPFLVPNSVKEIVDENGKVIGYAENTTPIDMEHICDYYNNNTNRPMSRGTVVDRSYIKLRDLYLSYDIPKKWLGKISISRVTIGVIGHNLLLWTPKENNFVDPESTTWGGDLESEFGEFAVGPSIRSVSFSLKITY